MYKSIQSCINEIFLMEDEVKRREFIKKQHGDKLSDSDVNAAIEHDPSKNKAYAPWIARGIAKGHIAHEDLPVVNKALEQFHTSKHTLEPADRDLNRYKSHRELHAKLNPNVGKSSVEITPEDQKYFNKKEASLIHHDHNSRVVVPLSDAAAKHFGKGTSWCTTGGAWNSYHSADDPLYVIHHHDGEKYQLHFGTHQHMDVHDHPIGASEIHKYKDTPATQSAEKHYRSLDAISDESPEIRHLNVLTTTRKSYEEPISKFPEAHNILKKNPNVAAEYYSTPNNDDQVENDIHENVIKHATEHLHNYLINWYSNKTFSDKFDKVKNIPEDHISNLAGRTYNSIKNSKAHDIDKITGINNIHHVFQDQHPYRLYAGNNMNKMYDMGLKHDMIKHYDNAMSGKYDEDVENHPTYQDTMQGEAQKYIRSRTAINLHHHIKRTGGVDKDVEHVIRKHNDYDTFLDLDED